MHRRRARRVQLETGSKGDNDVIKLALAAAIAATSLLPLAVSAQPYDNRDSGYSDQGPPGYQDDRGDNDNRQDYDRQDQDYGRGDRADDRGGDRDHGDQQFTGRVGSSWRDQDGRRCAWREVTFHDDGAQAYKWVTVCRD
jgi:hypothetical protein